MHSDLISVIVPCYNQAQYLDECLQSVLDQTYPNWECVIVNDGSPDDTEEVAKEWLAKDSRFKYFYKENGGLSSARNYGLDRSNGNWIQLLDCDDYIAAEKFMEQLLTVHEGNISICDYRKFNNQGQLLTENYLTPFSASGFDYNDLILKWETKLSIPCHCVIFKKSQLRFNEKLENHEDWVFWLQLFLNNENINYNKNIFAYYRFAEDSMSTNASVMTVGFIKACDFMLNFYRKKGEKKNKVLMEEKRRIIVEKLPHYNFKERVALKFPVIYQLYKGNPT